ncbi:glycoside hydrolase family 36 protein [Glacieibacterium frigidum]|uniref:Alpha-galactosidase n=1 Tax=Glacieibacterium frigidum TaxID=2593303 RepID=A0A552UHS4_9SPHN|nr:glycoside hydrolase family 36 protein [Glacieibacterium frigidum]TRW17774.1 alpha-galactosidase [Glacieibacterium frigidum]
MAVTALPRLLSIAHDGVHLAIELLEDRPVALLHVGAHPFINKMPERHRWAYRLVEARVAGEDHDYIGAGRFAGSGMGGRLRYISHSDVTDGAARRISIVQRDPLTGFETTSTLDIEDGVLVSRTEARNGGSAPLTLLDLSAFFLVGFASGPVPRGDRCRVSIPRNGWYAEFQWTHHSAGDLGLNNRFAFGSRHETVRSTGSWCSSNYLPMGYVEAASGGRGLLFETLHGGSWSWQIGETADELYLHVAGPGEAEGWWRTLAPGEVVTSPAVAVAPAPDFDAAMAAMTRHRRRTRLAGSDGSPVIFNDYMNCLMGDPDEAKILPLVDEAAALGAEVYCIDAGWYAKPGERWSFTLGDWSVNRDRFPRGLEPIVARIRERGMIPGLWFEIEAMTANHTGFADLPDDWFFVRHGRRVVSHRRHQLDFRNPAVRAFADRAIDAAVGDLGFEFLKLDYNFDSGIGSDLGAESPGQALIDYEVAFLAWLDALRARYPRLQIEHCASGGMRLARPYLDRTHNASNSDEGDPQQIARIAAAGATILLPEQNGTWALPKAGDDAERTAFAMACAIPFRMQLAGGAGELTPGQRTLVAEGVAAHKAVRDMVRDAVPSWPLGLPGYHDAWLCVALDAGGARLVALWRRDGGPDSITVPLPGAKAARLLYPSSLGSDWRLDGEQLFVTLAERCARIFMVET